MDNDRLSDMLERYGEVCTQHTASKILNVVPRTIARMCDEGRLRRVEHRVDVRSICEYIENPKAADFRSKAERNRSRTEVSAGDFLAAAQRGRWMKRR